MENTQQPLPSQQTDQLHSVSSIPSHSPSKTFTLHQYGAGFIILIVVILIIAVGVGGYILGANQNQAVLYPTPALPSIKPSPTPVDETANWKTYRNEEFGFEVRYPPVWDVRVNDLGNPEVVFQLLFDRKPISENVGPLTHPWPEMNIIILKRPHQNEDLQRAGVFPISESPVGSNEFRYEPITFLGLSANKIMSVSPLDIGDGPTMEFIFNFAGLGWSISYPTTDYEGSHAPIYDQILSTFQFIP